MFLSLYFSFTLLIPLPLEYTCKMIIKGFFSLYNKTYDHLLLILNFCCIFLIFHILFILFWHVTQLCEVPQRERCLQILLVTFQNINLKIQKLTGSVKPILTFKRKNYGKIGKKCFKNSNMLTKYSIFFKIIFSNPAF